MPRSSSRKRTEKRKIDSKKIPLPQPEKTRSSILQPLEPQTAGQELFLKAIQTKPIVICDGLAGTGKTFISFGSALKAYLGDGEIEKIIIVRPTFTSGDEPELGFLPGSLEDKMAPFVAPLLRDSAPLLLRKTRNSSDQRFVDKFGNGKDNVTTLLSQFDIEIIPLHLMRGRTFNFCFVILDEAQNCSMEDFKLFLTRIGKKCRVVIEGDSSQKDREDGSLPLLMKKLNNTDYVGLVKLDHTDIVRNPLIADLIRKLDA